MLEGLTHFKENIDYSIECKNLVKQKFEALLYIKSNKIGTDKKILNFMNDFSLSSLSDNELLKTIKETFPDFSKEEHKLLLEYYRVIDEINIAEISYRIGKKVYNLLDNTFGKVGKSMKNFEKQFKKD